MAMIPIRVNLFQLYIFITMLHLNIIYDHDPNAGRKSPQIFEGFSIHHIVRNWLAFWIDWLRGNLSSYTPLWLFGVKGWLRSKTASANDRPRGLVNELGLASELATIALVSGDANGHIHSIVSLSPFIRVGVLCHDLTPCWLHRYIWPWSECR